MNDFQTVCSWVQFKNDIEWKYDLLLKKDPVPIRCPVAGAFNFTQTGDFLFRTRILGGITKDPRHDVWGRTGRFYWKQNIKSYLITYDQLDAFTKYRCWVYQRADLN